MPASSVVETNGLTDTHQPDAMNGIEPDTGRKKSGNNHQQSSMSRMNTSMPVEECRRIYKHEIKVLWAEVEEFRKSCQEQIERQRRVLEEHKRNNEAALQRYIKEGELVSDSPNNNYAKELKKLEINMNILERNQGLLDQEKVLVEKEEILAKRQEKLQDYEKEVEEAEAMLNKRQSLCDKRAKEVETLNEDLLVMKQDFISTVEALENKSSCSTCDDEKEDDSDVVINSPEASAKARRHWTIARRHLIDKVTLLEATVQRYRTQLASATASVTAKDMMISRLNNQLNDMQNETDGKQLRIRQLESQLSLTTEEKLRSERNFDMLMEELQNIDIHSLQKVQKSPEVTPKQNGSVKHKLKKQNSSFSFFGGHDGDKSLSPRTRSSSASSIKDHFKRKLLNVNSHSIPSTNSLRTANAGSETKRDSKHKQRKHGSGDTEEVALEMEARISNKSGLNNSSDKQSTDAESKACTIQ